MYEGYVAFIEGYHNNDFENINDKLQEIMKDCSSVNKEK